MFLSVVVVDALGAGWCTHVCLLAVGCRFVLFFVGLSQFWELGFVLLMNRFTASWI